MAKKRVRTLSNGSEGMAAVAEETRPRPLVFISHDNRDMGLAAEFANLLRDASAGGVDTFLSSERKTTAGIEFGADWYDSIMTNIDACTNVVALLTPHSNGRPWILYEAGLAKGKLKKSVIGVVLGVEFRQATEGPFAQFQNCPEDEKSLTQLVMQLVTQNSNLQPREETVRGHVKAFREKLKGLLTQKPEEKPVRGAAFEVETVTKLFEEIKVMFRRLEERGSAASPAMLPFVNEDQIEEMELGVNSNSQVIVVTRDLKFDTRIKDVVRKNAERGVRYVYLMPDEGVNKMVASSFLADVPEARKNLEFLYLTDFHFPLDLVVYDPSGETRSAYICLPSESGAPLPKAICLKEPQSLRATANSLISIASALRGQVDGGGGRPPRRGAR